MTIYNRIEETTTTTGLGTIATLVVQITLLFSISVLAETPEQISDRVNEHWWGTKNQCYVVAVMKKIELDMAGYDSTINIINVGRGRRHAVVEHNGMCYDDLQGVTLGVNPCVDIYRRYPLVRIQ